MGIRADTTAAWQLLSQKPRKGEREKHVLLQSSVISKSSSDKQVLILAFSPLPATVEYQRDTSTDTGEVSADIGSDREHRTFIYLSLCVLSLQLYLYFLSLLSYTLPLISSSAFGSTMSFKQVAYRLNNLARLEWYKQAFIWMKIKPVVLFKV